MLKYFCINYNHKKLKSSIQRYIFITKSASQLIICILYILSRMKQETCLRNVVSKLSQEFPEHTSKHLILISLISFFNTCSIILNFVSLAIFTVNRIMISLQIIRDLKIWLKQANIPTWLVCIIQNVIRSLNIFVY